MHRKCLPLPCTHDSLPPGRVAHPILRTQRAHRAEEPDVGSPYVGIGDAPGSETSPALSTREHTPRLLLLDLLEDDVILGAEGQTELTGELAALNAAA